MWIYQLQMSFLCRINKVKASVKKDAPMSKSWLCRDFNTQILFSIKQRIDTRTVDFKARKGNVL